MDIKILQKIKPKLTYPSDNWERLEWLWKNNQPITFYNWECPPRQKVKDPKNGSWINFDVDIKKVVEGNKLDEFTEIPRLCSVSNLERWFINQVVKKNPQANYIKIVADTNGLYLFPKSKQILGEKKLNLLSKKFQKLLTNYARENIDQKYPTIVLWTNLIKPFQKEYNFFFDYVYENFSEKESIVPRKIYSHWMSRIGEHIGLTDQEKENKIETVKRAVASYAAEGMLFAILNSVNTFPNPVWANFEEPPENGQTTEILRQRYGIEKLPILYFAEEKEE